MLSTPSGTSTGNGRTSVFIYNIGASGCGNRGVISGTSYAAGYLTPVTGMLGSGFNVRANLVAAIRSAATARGAISNPSVGS